MFEPSSYDASKKIKGRNRHILVDTLGLLLGVVVRPADVPDRDGTIQSWDLPIAAHALALGHTVVTDNAREFSSVDDLRVENWLR